MTGWSEAETTALAARAARGAGMAPAQAALYGAAAAAHLAAGNEPDILANALKDPETQVVITAIAAFPAGPICSPEHPLTEALLKSLPGHATQTHYAPETPSPPRRPKRLTVPDALAAFWQEFAQKTYVPDSATSHTGAGGTED